MHCQHCAKGEARNDDIDVKCFDSLFDQVEAVGSLAIIGGEPLLNINALYYLYDALCKRGIPIFEFQVITNGSIYSEKFIAIIKQFRKLIDNSCVIFLKDGVNYVPENNISRIKIGVSLDRFHEQHELCAANYEKYKKELSGYADVLRKMGGNSPFKSGRAKNLDCAKWEVDYRLPFERRQRIELLSKDFKPTSCETDYNLNP